MTFPTSALDLAIAAAAPIVGVSVGDPGDRTTWRIDFAPEATTEQRAAAQAALLAWTVPDPLPTDVAAQPTRVAAALAVQVADGDVSGITGAFNIVAALYMDVGTYLVLFFEPQLDTDYFVDASGPGVHMAVTDKATDSFTVTAENAAGSAPADPAEFHVNVWRS